MPAVLHTKRRGDPPSKVGPGTMTQRYATRIMESRMLSVIA